MMLIVGERRGGRAGQRIIHHAIKYTPEMSEVRRSKRIASINDELSVTAENAAKAAIKPLTVLKKALKKTKVANKVTKPKAAPTKVIKPAKKAAVNAKPAKSKSRAAKKEDAVVLDEDEDEAEEEPEVEELEELEIGDEIPKSLKVTLQDGTVVSLLERAKKSHKLVIFAYPRASTPGCTRQAKGFRDEYKELQDAGADVLGLSADTGKAQTNFKIKQELPYDLICDVKKELISLLGCQKYPSGVIRSHFIFVDGILEVKKVKVSPEDSFKGALDQVKSL
jgi:peroxiredoxin Q/BCP